MKEHKSLIISLVLFAFSLTTAILLLPANCAFFEPTPGPFACDAIPNNCCKQGIEFIISHVVLFVGFALAAGGIYFYFQSEKTLRNRDQKKLFE